MTDGSVVLYAQAGFMGARIAWMQGPTERSTASLDELAAAEVLVNYGFRDSLHHHNARGLRFNGWRCTYCKFVGFLYPHGTDYG